MDSESNTSHITLKGIFHRIVYTNDENNYSVIRFIEEGVSQPVTVVGIMPGVVQGQHAVIKGEWIYSQRFGQQFKVISWHECQPSTRDGIERFLGSGLIEGIGHEMARRIVSKFGEHTLDIIDSQPGRLREIAGIGQKRIKMIADGWKKHQNTRHILIGLNSLGLSPSLALRIFNRYKDESLKILESNPYRLAYEMHGIGFHTADEIALKSGNPPDSPERIQAAVYYFLYNYSEEGDVYTPLEKIVQKVSRELNVPFESVAKTMGVMERAQKIVIERDRTDVPVYVKMLYDCEVSIAGRVRQMMCQEASHAIEMPNTLLTEIARNQEIYIDDELRSLLPKLLAKQIMIITGGPGTGKTTLVQLILGIMQFAGLSSCLAAPTGRAAKRLTETTGLEAVTIHRLMEYVPQHDYFQRTANFPLDADVVIVDEASMIDLELMHHLIIAIKDGARLILVGDKDQLPSVGPGAVLHHLLEVENIPKLVLTRIYRQSENSMIVHNAHRINHGQNIILKEEADDFYFVEKENPDEILAIIKKLLTERIPSKFGMHPMRDVQVLSPMRKGVLGIDNLNAVLQQLLNPSRESVSYGNIVFKSGDKVMQVRNNYDIDIYNGDIGYIQSVDAETGQMAIDFFGRTVLYERAWLEQLATAYAISIHKSQGSEYPAVVIPLQEQHSIMLQRNLLYTAVTRAKRLVVIVGTKSALKQCLCNSRIRERNSLLAVRCGGNTICG
ncbi:ATP-dependent RecD-like DNA helicase [bacterium]|nr:ATP-dependent RecD-like DNA helicase [bacterium]